MPDNPTCRGGCGTVFTTAPPWHRLCHGCLATLARQGVQPDPDWPAEQLPPVCECCGQRLIPVIPIPATA